MFLKLSNFKNKKQKLQNVCTCPWSAIYFQQGDRVSQCNKLSKLLRGVYK